MDLCSEEQQNIIYEVEKGSNVVVDACAGSGKSTTILSTAKYLKDKRSNEKCSNNKYLKDKCSKDKH